MMLATVLDWIRERPSIMVGGMGWLVLSTAVCGLFSWSRRRDRRQGESGLDRLGLDDQQLQQVRLENARRRERLARLADDRIGDLPVRSDRPAERWRRLSNGTVVPLNEAAKEAERGRQALRRQREHDEEGR